MLDPLSGMIHRHACIHGPVMLMYHSVRAGSGIPSWPWAVSMERFCAQLDFLRAEGWATATMAELVDAPDKWRGRTVVITFDDGYEDNYPAFEALQQRDMRASWFLVSGSVGQAPAWQDTDMPSLRLLASAQLREMHGAGMEVGSHTVSHARLPSLDDGALSRELRESRERIGELIGAEVTSLAYPYGLWDARCVEAARAAGYRRACTTRTGWALRDNDPYTLRRLTVYNTDTVSTLARKMAYATNDASWPTWFTAQSRRLLGRVARS